MLYVVPRRLTTSCMGACIPAPTGVCSAGKGQCAGAERTHVRRRKALRRVEDRRGRHAVELADLRRTLHHLHGVLVVADLVLRADNIVSVVELLRLCGKGDGIDNGVPEWRS